MKKLLRKWLKRQIIKAQAELKQDVFEWIYDSPLSTWKDKLFCLKNRNKKEAGSYGGEDYDWLIDSK